MNKRRERALEAFLYITFPIALFAGCTGLGNKHNEVASSHEYSMSADSLEYSNDDAENWSANRYFGTLHSDNVAAAPMNNSADITVTDITESMPLQAVFTYKAGATQVKKPEVEVLSKHAQFLAAHPSLLLSVIGYADRRGTAVYNQHLSEKRAQKVYKILVSYGAPRQQLIVDANNGVASVNEGGDEVNSRRVELVYSIPSMVSSAL